MTAPSGCAVSLSYELSNSTPKRAQNPAAAINITTFFGACIAVEGIVDCKASKSRDSLALAMGGAVRTVRANGA